MFVFVIKKKYCKNENFEEKIKTFNCKIDIKNWVHLEGSYDYNVVQFCHR